MPENRKFLVRLFHDVSSRQWFFILWGLLAGFFVYLIYRYYQNTIRRNFKNDK